VAGNVKLQVRNYRDLGVVINQAIIPGV
jgi:hypothetical protein